MKNSYILINLIFAGIIACIMLYSGIFSDVTANHPVSCIHTMITGKPCSSCGLSRSFSAMVRGKIREAKMYNINGPKIFSFFLIQFFLRLFLNCLIYFRQFYSRLLWTGDALISLVLFGYCFSGLIFFY